MKSRFAPVKRPLLALTAMAAAIALTGIMPAHAVAHNNLSFPGTTGRVRVRPVFQDRTGLTGLQVGDTKAPASNPNRTVGDVPAVLPDLYPSPCTPAPGDCLRTLALNDGSVNPSVDLLNGGDGHTHYHAGDSKLILNEVAGFRAGDTILVGSPNCNYSLLQLTCKRFVPGFGLINEQPNGEVAYVVGGDIGVDDHGVGVLELRDGLQFEHLEGSVVTKLPTLYQGQQMRVDINHEDLLDCGLKDTDNDPLTPDVYACGTANDVAVTAFFVPPQGSHDPSFPRRPLTLNRDTNATSAIVLGACGIPGNACAPHFFSFYIPKEITGTATIGRTFSVDKPDTWYTVVVEAKDVTDGHVVADGVARFKLNPTAIVNLRAENPEFPGSSTFFPTESVEITGGVRDNTSSITLSGFNARPAEDIVTDVAVTNPGGGTSYYQTNSCVDTDPTAADVCGGNIFGSQPNGHGNFMITYGGPQGVYLDFTDGTCNPETNIIVPCIGALFTMLDTFDTGTYDVTASLRGYAPAVTASTTFDVVLI